MLPHEYNCKLMRNTTPSMRFENDEIFTEWQTKSKAKLMELLGLPLQKADNLLEIEFEKDHQDFKEIRFKFQSEPDYFVPCHLLIPNTNKEQYKLAICLQGHSKGMHVSMGRAKYDSERGKETVNDRNFAIHAVNQGYSALVIEQRNFGECGGTEEGPDCYKSSMAALLIGRTTIGERVFDVSRAIDVVTENYDFIDKDNIICLGNSGGGTATFYAACLDERIKYALPSFQYALLRTLSEQSDTAHATMYQT